VSPALSVRSVLRQLDDHSWWCTTLGQCHPYDRRSLLGCRQPVVAIGRVLWVDPTHTPGTRHSHLSLTTKPRPSWTHNTYYMYSIACYRFMITGTKNRSGRLYRPTQTKLRLGYDRERERERERGPGIWRPSWACWGEHSSQSRPWVSQAAHPV